MASIKSYKNKNGDKLYRIQLYGGLNPQTGKVQRINRRGFKSKKEATLEASRLELEVAQGGIQKENNIKFEEVYHHWYQAYINTVRESTYARTDAMFNNHILPAFGNKRIRTIKINEIQRAVNQWFKLAPNNFKKWFNYTSNVFDYAIKEQYIKDNPCKLVNIPKKQIAYGDKPANFWDKNQLLNFFSYIYPDKELEKYTLFRVLAFAGVRRGECLALTWDDIDFNEQTIRINKTLTQGLKGKQIVQAPKTRKGRRTIKMDKSTMDYLEQWRLSQRKRYLMLGFNTFQKSQLVFASSTNNHKCLNTPAKWLKKIIKEHNLTKITVHGFRHTHASALFSAGASIKEVQERLGHEDIQTTMDIYTHVTNQQNQEAVNKLVKYLNF
ncbi:bacteriophage integrase [Apilactobacillus ozensis DSM 23829 = JCM 17196]|uniref:Bacteriophage integrase n=1 Tax=Apilactobacillus ozensis DSM 23829 = JCM 17196 TaxID=1423781 RepID=A0A0R2AY13_9LACO|nr:tyrosine-type recombinase/integrase [Apilactobacillus ozensis]KRM67740.1 bacteriophage integrase [Apilactobacillus ozensis DSM 23829 = JCM 17196]